MPVPSLPEKFVYNKTTLLTYEDSSKAQSLFGRYAQFKNDHLCV